MSNTRARPLRICIVCWVEEEGSDKYDGVVPQVAAALKSGGHEVSILGIHGDVQQFAAELIARRPELVFNLVEGFGDGYFGDVSAVAMYELLDLKHTGGGPGEFYISGDKALSKKILAFENLAFPRFAVFSRNADFETGGNLRMPLFVKPLRMDASLGIEAASLVHNATTLMKRVEHIHTTLNDDALAEEFIEGREFYVGVLGNDQLMALPPIEMDFTGMPKDLPHILDSKAKWEVNSVEYKGTKAVVAKISPELTARIQKVALEAYRSLRVRDYGRVDLRVADSGEIYVIEVNASCYLESTGEFAMAAAAAGIAYEDLIHRIVDLSMARYENRAPRSRSPKREIAKAV